MPVRCPWPRKEPWFSQLSSSDWRFDVQKCTAPGRFGGQMGSLDETKYNTRIEQKQEDWIRLACGNSGRDGWNWDVDFSLWLVRTCFFMTWAWPRDTTKTWRSPRNIENGFRQNKHVLKLQETFLIVSLLFSSFFNLLRWLYFRCFFKSLAASCQAAMKDFHTCPRQGPIVGMTEDTMNAYRQAKDCSKSWLCWMGCQKSSTKRDGNRGLGQRKIDWNLIDSAGG